MARLTPPSASTGEARSGLVLRLLSCAYIFKTRQPVRSCSLPARLHLPQCKPVRNRRSSSFCGWTCSASTVCSAHIQHEVSVRTKSTVRNRTLGSSQVCAAAAMEPLEHRTLLSTSLTGLDLTYGDHGIATITNDRPATVVTRASLRWPDGKMILAGYAPTSTETAGALVLARINRNGTLDRTFQHDGFAITPTADGSSFFVSSIVAHGDNVLVGGTLRSDDGRGGYGREVEELIQFTSDGAVDLTFGHWGRVAFNPFHESVSLSCLAIQSDGKILAGGSQSSSYVPGQHMFSVTRLNADGSFDQTFNSGGTIFTSFLANNGISDAQLRALAVATDGRIVAAGDGTGAGVAAFAVAVYAPDGSPDTSFAPGGHIQILTGLRRAAVRAVAIRSDGEFFIAGSSATRRDPHGATALTVLSITPRGELAKFFGHRGVVRQYVPQSN